MAKWADWADIPHQDKKRRSPSNPYLKDVQALVETMPKDEAGRPVDRSAGIKVETVDNESLDRVLNWLWRAGDAARPKVTVSQHRAPNADDPNKTDIFFWTKPRITRRKAKPGDRPKASKDGKLFTGEEVERFKGTLKDSGWTVSE